MSRVKRGTVTKRRHKRLLKQTKGFWDTKKCFKRARETLLRALKFAFIGRKLKKRDLEPYSLQESMQLAKLMRFLIVPLCMHSKG